MDHNRAMAAGDAAVGDRDVIVGHAADRIQSDLEVVNAVLIDEPILGGGHIARRVCEQRLDFALM